MHQPTLQPQHIIPAIEFLLNRQELSPVQREEARRIALLNALARLLHVSPNELAALLATSLPEQATS
ncbi:MAG: hypothetical protein GFH27_549281n60 [Chloroflexi bacterium AL-W]|nr:hypothetical protein [Chloroflexi bacterium AL-N1]NOK65946.1 hypothetical protein [Chloroflexi bacterium AL-N10]NOK72827.1 hypothetical protein [Chloroflexi bacterium AL-N5]NOK79724.1 hypothetical protein [Chloroflexi bacterium AL-W]NOK88420.1 hypothetical protein [Chloroflexi bacterium AL-N15]